MNKNIFSLSAVTLCFSMLTGCSLLDRSEFVMPEINIPDNWQQSDTLEMRSATTEKWWKQFNNVELNSLIEQALQTNNDLTIATLSLRKARIEAGISDKEQLPTFSFSGESSKEKSFDSGDLDNSYSTTTSLSYELDLWGRLSAEADVTQWVAQASAEDRESIAQSLVVTVASLYWEIGYLNQRIHLTDENIKGLKQIISIALHQYDAGAGTQLAVLEARQSLYKQEVSHSQLQHQLIESKNALSIILNQPLQSAILDINTLPEGMLPDIAVGGPADLLLRRPDVRASLYKLKSALANKDAVASGYFPELTLTGSLGTSSSHLLELLQNPVGKLGSELTLPFIEWNKMQMNKDISELEYKMAIIDYRTTLYDALKEVSNYLSARQHYQYQGKKLHIQYTNLQQIEMIYESKYRAGAINSIDWINAIEDTHDLQASLLENQYNQFITQAKLYQSLGGADIAPEITND